MTLLPAYSRDYKSKKEVLEAFDSNKDFQIADIMHPNVGGYVTKEELVAAGEKSVNIRYKACTQVCVVKL